MSRHRCPSCRCGSVTSEATLVAWVKQGVKAEGVDYFCDPRCRTCPPSEGRCPRDPYCKQYVNERQPA